MLLEDEKMVVTTAENGEEAVDMVFQSVPGRFAFMQYNSINMRLSLLLQKDLFCIYRTKYVIVTIYAIPSAMWWH